MHQKLPLRHNPRYLNSTLKSTETRAVGSWHRLRGCVGWHAFRHTLATNLRSQGVDAKAAQWLLRHASLRVTMDVYTRVVSAEEWNANGLHVGLLLGKS
ncbi:tyrosine-type recombinase/integrase [Granulicella sp. 5B5]|nr:tyrosine-type recombinase/integrase [Granulicella sp. 5B5]